MSTTTTHYSLIKPGVNDPTDQDLWGGYLNSDLDVIDDVLFSAQRWVMSAKTANYSVLSSEIKTMFMGDATTAGFTIELPTLSSVSTGFEVSVKKTDATTNVVTVKGNGTELIDQANTYLLTNQDDVIVLVSDATAWRVQSVTNPSTLADVRVLQTATYQTGAVASGSGTIPNDDSIPQITEGDEYMSLVFTPVDAASTLTIEVTGYFSSDSVVGLVCALFKDAVTDALACGVYDTVQSRLDSIPFTHTMISGTTSPITFRVRAGGNIGTTTFNGQSGTRRYGGAIASSIKITETKP